MATRTLQPSEYDIQREVEALRDIRRRSTTPGALTIDPDLPNQSPPSSPTSFRLGSSPVSPTFNTSSSYSDKSSNEGGSSSITTVNSDDSVPAPNYPADDPFHLFWVPASLHPEIAPAEFRAFLKEHARTPPTSDDETNSSERSPSLSSSSLSRKKSMLSRQYRPAEHDGVENERVVPLRRNRSGMYVNRGPQLTISDLQKLEELAEQASENDDPSRLRNVLRRSLSLNMSPSAIDQMDEMPEMGDEADVPIIVPPPGQILRRAARTKIRKPSLPGDGGGHRFGSSRRAPPMRGSTAIESRTSSDISSSDHGDSNESGPPVQRRKTFSEEGPSRRPDSFSEETSIFDAYTRDEEELTPPVVVTSSPPPNPEQPDVPMVQLPSDIHSTLLEALGPVIHHPQPQHLTPQAPAEHNEPSRTPSPLEPSPSSTDRPNLPQAPLPFLSTIPAPPSQPHRKDKDKKGLFGKWGGDKGGKKNAKEKERENKERTPEREKDPGFFGSLFGGSSRKKQDETSPPLLLPGGTSGREAAQALLGASKSKSFVSPLSPALSSGISPNSYARYPIHVERAIYRLSHIKLANPRRPLYEQVLISNLMFWYLGVINKAQNSTSPPNGQPTGMGTQTTSPPVEEVDIEKERNERERQELWDKAEKERQEKERIDREQREHEVEVRKKESGKRGSLTKTPVPGSPGGSRRAEMPIKGPQYEMQHRVMEQEYGAYNGQPQQGMPMNRTTSAPVGNDNSQPFLRNPQVSQFNTSPNLVQSQPGEPFYYVANSIQNQSQQSGLPPGAMPPEQPSRQQVSRPHSSSSPPPTPTSHPSRPIPLQNHGKQPSNIGRSGPTTSQDNLRLGGDGERAPSRSLSATAVPSSSHTNGRLRKGSSAHAAVPTHGRRPRSSEGLQAQNMTGEEEDMPLAMWQQQRRR